MFSRKGFIKMIASVLIILMCMVMVPLTAGDKVSAAGPDTSNYSILNPHRSSGVPMGDGKVFDYTFKIYPKRSMKYKITVNCVCPGFVKTSMQDREIVWEGELRGMTPQEILVLSKTRGAEITRETELFEKVCFGGYKPAAVEFEAAYSCYKQSWKALAGKNKKRRDKKVQSAG